MLIGGGGVNSYLFVFCPTSFFRRQLFLSLISNEIERHNYNAITNIKNFFRYDLNALTPGYIHLLPNSPTQNGSDSILTFYAALPSGNIIPKHILGTIFVNQQENILAIEIIVQDVDEIFAPPGEREILTPQQRENRVPILIINFRVEKVSVYPKIRFESVEDALFNTKLGTKLSKLSKSPNFVMRK